ncbi:hypothetical protein BO221_44895 [Archangium sp. Cb G35]|nr:hypothetical protein BO221_44895 [Archangium sp. Cb G35]
MRTCLAECAKGFADDRAYGLTGRSQPDALGEADQESVSALERVTDSVSSACDGNAACNSRIHRML